MRAARKERSRVSRFLSGNREEPTLSRFLPRFVSSRRFDSTHQEKPLPIVDRLLLVRSCSGRRRRRSRCHRGIAFLCYRFLIQGVSLARKKKNRNE